MALYWKVALVSAVVAPFIAFLGAVVLVWNRYVFATDLYLLFGMYAITAIGVTIGYHRMLTHQGFESPKWVRALFLILGSMATFGSKPIEWAATHVKHHAHSDEEGDPHSPLEGFVHGHIGWMFKDDSYGDPKIYTPELLNDPVVMFVSRHMLLWTFLALAIPFAIGGWTGLLWGGFVRFFFTTHVMWSVNSVCHTFGRREFQTTDESRNEWVVGLLAFGEGWHNNHHAFPRNAFHGMKWYQFDLSGIIISTLEKLGLVWNVQRVAVETVEAHKLRTDNTLSAQADLRAQLQQSLEGADAELQTFFATTIRSSTKGMDSDMQRLEQLYADAMKRIRRIQKFVARARHMKRQKQMAYTAEVQQILTRVREEVQRRRASFDPQAVS